MLEYFLKLNVRKKKILWISLAQDYFTSDHCYKPKCKEGNCVAWKMNGRITFRSKKYRSLGVLVDNLLNRSSQCGDVTERANVVLRWINGELGIGRLYYLIYLALG